MHSTSAPIVTTRTWPAALVLLAIALFFGFGLPAINASLPATATQAAGQTIDLGNGVTVVTPAGWSNDVAKTKPQDTLALLRDGSSLVATAFPWTGTEAELVERTRNLFEGLQHYRVRGPTVAMRTGSGLPGTTYAIYNEQYDGRVWLGVLPGGKSGFAVRLRNIAGQGDAALRDAQALVDSLQYSEAR